METWRKYVANNLELERQCEFDEEELRVIEEIKKVLPKHGNQYAWEELHKELQLMVLKGYSGRKDRAGDSAKAVAEIVAWRKRNKVDTLLDLRLPGQDEYYRGWKSYIAGEDKFGHLISFERVQEIDPQLLSKLRIEDMLLLRAQHIEAINMLKWRTSMRIGHRICKYIFIMDLQGLAVRKHFTPKVRDILGPIFKVSGDYYPDSLWTMFLVNAPMTFRLVWRAISPMVDPVTKTKIRMSGSEREHIEAMQRTGIPLSSIPEKIGGSCKVVDIQSVVNEIYDNRQGRGKGRQVKGGDPVNPLEGFTPSTLAAGARSMSVLRSTASGTRSPSGEQAESEMDGGDMGKQVFEEENVIVAGYLFKRGSLNSAFKRRYFILTPYGLYYFIGKPTKDNHQVRGKIDLHLITSAMTVPDNEGRTELFNICVPGRVYHLQVDMNQEDDEVERSSSRNSVRRNSASGTSGRTNGSSASTKSASGLSRTLTWLSGGNTETNQRSSVRRTSTKRRSKRANSTIVSTESGAAGTSVGDDEDKLPVASIAARQWVRYINEAAEEDRCSLESETNQVAINTQHMDYIRGGYLSKKGWFSHGWRKRYIVLTSHRLLYYSDRPDKPGCQLKGVIDLHLVKRVTVHKKKPGRFNVHTPVRVFKFRLATKPQEQSEVEEWVEKIDEAAQNERLANEMRDESDGAVIDDDDSSVTYGLSFLSDLSFAQIRAAFANASPTALLDQVVSVAAEVIRVAEEHNMLSKDFSATRSMEERMQIVKRRIAYMFSMSNSRSRNRLSRGASAKQIKEKEDSDILRRHSRRGSAALPVDK